LNVAPVTATVRAAISASSRTGFKKGDGVPKEPSSNFWALRSSWKSTKQKRDEVKAKKRAELEKQLEESEEGRREEGGEEAA